MLEKTLERIMAIALQVHPLLDESDFLNRIVGEVREILESDRTLIYRFLPDGDGVVAYESVNPHWMAIQGQLIYDPCFQAKWVEQYQQGRIGVLEDAETDSVDPCYKGLLTRLQIRANLVVPILLKSWEPQQTALSVSELWGLFIIHQCGKPRHWHPTEISGLQAVALQLGMALHRWRHLRLDTTWFGVRSPLLDRPSSSREQKLMPDLKVSQPFSAPPSLALPSPVTSFPKGFSRQEFAICDRLQTPLWIFDLQNLQMWWANQAALYIWNAESREELLNRNFSDMSESTQIRLQHYRQQFQQGKTIAEDWTFYPKDHPINVRCLFSGIEIEEGRIAMLVEGIVETPHPIDENTLRSIEALRHTPTIVSLYTKDGVPLMQNPAALHCYGDTQYPNPSIKNTFLSRFVNPTVRQQALEIVQRGEVFSVETQIFTLQGIRWHRLDARQTRDPVTGHPSILVNEQDITDRQTTLHQNQRMEQELRWKEALLRSMTDTSLLAFYVVDNRTDRILYLNHHFCEIWGLQHLEHQMRLGVLKNNDIIPTCLQLIADISGFIESCKPLQSEENRCTIEDEIQFVDGRTIRRFSSQIRSSQGLYFGRLYIFEDISDRVRTQEALRDSEERYHSVVAAMAEGIVLQQADGRITACNDSAERILGITADQMMGRTSLDSRWRTIRENGVPFPGESHPAIVTLQTGQPLFNVVMGVHKPDGNLTWISINSQPLFQPDRLHPYAVVTSFTDITIRKQAEQALQQQAERERMIFAIAQRIRQSLNLEDILNTTVAEVRQFLQADRVIIYRFNPDWSGVVIKESVAEGWSTILNREITDTYFVETQGQSYRQGKIQATFDIYTAGLAPCHIALLEQLQVRAKLVVPIIESANVGHNSRLDAGSAAENHLWGLLVAHQCSSPREWYPLEVELLEQLATQVAIAIQQSGLHQQLQLVNQQLEKLVMVDPLTQVANRRCFDSNLHQAWHSLLPEQRPLSLLLCDIDYFKQYNDTYGHAAGDRCLIFVAQALKRAVQSDNDLVVRYGGEEFAVVLPNTDSDAAVQVTLKIYQAIRELNLPHISSGVIPQVTLSTGIATVIPKASLGPIHLVEMADRALYKAKGNGRNGFWIA